jgi:PAS domain S-box-containing protein
MKKSYLIIALLIIALSLFSTDSDSNKLNTANVTFPEAQPEFTSDKAEENDSTKSEIFNEDDFQPVDTSATIKGDTEKYESIISIGEYHLKMKQYQTAANYFDTATALAEELKDNVKIGDSNYFLGKCHWNIGNFRIALKHFQISLDINQSIGDKIQISRLFNNIGSIHYRLGNYDDAIDNLLKALRIKEELGDDNLIASTLNNLGNMFLQLKQTSDAMMYYKRALVLYEKGENETKIAKANNNIGNVYVQDGLYDNALVYYLKTLQIYEKTDNPKGLSAVLNNLGNLYEELNKDMEALKYLKRALKIKRKLNDKYGISTTAMTIGDLYHKQKNYRESEKHLLISYEVSKEINAFTNLKDVCFILTKLYKNKKNYEKAYRYGMTYITLKDSLLNELKTEKIVELETKYESEKKEIEILRLENEGELKDKLTFRLWFIIIVVFAASMIIIRLYIQKGKQNIELGKEIEERKRAQDELTRYKTQLEDMVKMKTTDLLESEITARTVIESLDVAFVLIDCKGKILSINDMAAKEFYKDKNELTNVCLYDLMPAEQVDRRKDKVNEVLISGKASHYIESTKNMSFDISLYPIFSPKGMIEKIAYFNRDITEQQNYETEIKKNLREKDFLLSEIQHRVNNNMQSITGMMKMQLPEFVNTREKELFQESQCRIKAMSLVHEMANKSLDAKAISFKKYIQFLFKNINLEYSDNTRNIRFEITADDIMLDINLAVPCGIILNELITNSIKFAFPEDTKGVIKVGLTFKNGNYSLFVKDTGIGFEKIPKFDAVRSKGLYLVHILSLQLRAQNVVENDSGASITLNFKNVKLRTYNEIPDSIKGNKKT